MKSPSKIPEGLLLCSTFNHIFFLLNKNNRHNCSENLSNCVHFDIKIEKNYEQTGFHKYYLFDISHYWE